jgi:hypothetical protein
VAKKPAQADLLEKLLSDGRAHRTDEILQKVYGDEHLGLARVGARIWDIKKRGRIIDSWRDKRDGRFTGLHWYMDITEAVRKAKATVAEDEAVAAAKSVNPEPLHKVQPGHLW